MILRLILISKLQLPITELGIPQLIENVNKWLMNILACTGWNTEAAKVTENISRTEDVLLRRLD